MANTIQDAIQPAAWFKALPRQQFSTFEPVPSPVEWFSVYKIRPDLYVIYEPKNFQEVMCFLYIGSEKALLVDSGMGIGNIKLVIDSLYQGEIILVNTHCHFDHIGGNHYFDKAHIIGHPVAIKRAHEGLSHDYLYPEISGESTVLPFPDEFDPDNYTIAPYNYEVISEGYTFDLGDRSVEVLETPGHTQDSLMLYDEKNNLLFTGDTYYPATIYTHMDSGDGLISEFEVFSDTIHKLAAKYSGCTLIASHNEPVRPGSILCDLADAFDGIQNGTLPYEVDTQGLKKYSFDDFAIVTK